MADLNDTGSDTQQMMPFIEAVKTCLHKYSLFSGRASRSEFWWFYLFSVFCTNIAAAADTSLFGTVYGQGWMSTAVACLLTVPSLAVQARRLHDTGRSGWWMLLVLTIVGIPVLFVFNIFSSNPGANKYGPQPGMGH